MKQIDNYEQFCKAFGSDDEELINEAKLLLFIQNWIIRILDHIDEDTLDYSLKKMIEQDSNKIVNMSNKKDALSNIAEASELAFRHLNERLREKIVRENVRMPVYKVKEINSYGVNWLSRQSGQTVRQKISSAGNSIMAVQRRMSLDTAENRLFIAFAKEMYERLNVKLESMCSNDIRKINEEEDFRDELAMFLRRDDIKEIKRWENLPPNNTLLSDQNYKKIWHAWNEIKKLDERVKNDSDLIGKRLTTIIFVELLVYLKDVLRIPQEPVEINYDEYTVHLCEKELFCLDPNGIDFRISKEDNCISITYANKKISITFTGNKAIIKSKEKTEEYDITKDTIYTCVRRIAFDLHITELKRNNVSMIKSRETQIFNSVIVDLFSLHPGYIADGDDYKKLSERILQQRYLGRDIDGDEKYYYIPCDDANSIKMISGITKTYTIPFAVDSGSMEQMKRLMHMMENYIIADEFTYIFPDAYNEFQLSMVHKAAKMVYRKVRNVPLSIAAAFKYQTTVDFEDNFEPGDFLLIVNLIDDEVTFTLVAGEYDEDLKDTLKEYKGVVWERYPTSTALFKKEIYNKVVDKITKAGCAKSEKIYKLLGLEGLVDEVDRLSVFFGSEWFQIKSEIKAIYNDFTLDITEAVKLFLKRNRTVVRDSDVHILSIVDNFIYKGTLSYTIIGKQEVLEGCRELKTLEKLTDVSLWHDHLPSLAIKLMYGKFDLIKNAMVKPRFDEKQIIPIRGSFTLPKNCEEYHFNLVQDENARKMQYEAVIKNPAFPLKNDVECELLMTYQYGAEEPYELIFVPKNAKTAGFSEAKVQWFRLEKYDITKLKAPDFPKKMSWEDIEHYPGLEGDFINILDVIEDRFKLFNEGYYTADISGTAMQQDQYGKWKGEFPFEKDGETIKILWSQNSSNANNPPLLNISFWIIPVIDKKKKRYHIPDLMAAKTRDNLWFINKRECSQCIVKFEYEGEVRKISIIDQNFDMPDRFSTDINNVTFEVFEMKNGNLQAINIHNEDGVAAPKRFRAVNICESGKVPEPPRFFNSYFEKWIKILFANNRSLAERECPVSFQICFVKSVKYWLRLFCQYKDPKDKRDLFALLSLAAKDIGKDYYKVAYLMLKMYKSDEINIPYEIGCAFCDLTNNMQKRLMKATLKIVSEDYEAIAILAKAMWHNESFVYNADSDLLLDNYFPKAVDYIGRTLHNGAYKKYLGNIRYCLEYILGIMRLRNLNDDMITDKYLSLNNPKMQELYRYLEIMVDRKIELCSFLKFENTSKGIYDNICDLIYALFVYVTGNDTEGEIRISININE